MLERDKIGQIAPLVKVGSSQQSEGENPTTHTERSNVEGSFRSNDNEFRTPGSNTSGKLQSKLATPKIPDQDPINYLPPVETNLLKAPVKPDQSNLGMSSVAPVVSLMMGAFAAKGFDFMAYGDFSGTLLSIFGGGAFVLNLVVSITKNEEFVVQKTADQVQKEAAVNAKKLPAPESRLQGMVKEVLSKFAAFQGKPDDYLKRFNLVSQYTPVASAVVGLSSALLSYSFSNSVNPFLIATVGATSAVAVEIAANVYKSMIHPNRVK